MKNEDDCNNKTQQQPKPPEQQQSSQNQLSPLFPTSTTPTYNLGNIYQNDKPPAAAVGDAASAAAGAAVSDSGTLQEKNIQKSNRGPDVNMESNYISPTISALVRGLHDNLIGDGHTLKLPLFHLDDEEESEHLSLQDQTESNRTLTDLKSYTEQKPSDLQQEEVQKDFLKSSAIFKTKSDSIINVLQHTILAHTLTNSSPKTTNLTDELVLPLEHVGQQHAQDQHHNHHHHHHHRHNNNHNLFHLHPSLPRLVVDFAGSPTNNNNGDTTHKLLESAAPSSPGGGRRLSQFNFNLRRFSHNLTAPVLFKSFYFLLLLMCLHFLNGIHSVLEFVVCLLLFTEWPL